MKNPPISYCLVSLRREIRARADFEFRIAIVIKGERVEVELEMVIRVEEPRIFVKNFALVDRVRENSTEVVIGRP